jgi:hypothetical protein
LIQAIALLSLLFEPTIFDNMFSYQANSNTDLTEDQAFNHVPCVAGKTFTIQDLYLFVIE